MIIDIRNHTICLEMNKKYLSPFKATLDRNFLYAVKLKDQSILENESYKKGKYIILINFDGVNIYNDNRTLIKFQMLDKERLIEEGIGYESYHIILPNILKLDYNKCNDLEKLLMIFNLDTKEDLKKY